MSDSDFLLMHYEEEMLPRIEAGHPFPHSEYAKTTGLRGVAHDTYRHMIDGHVLTKECVADVPVVIGFDVSGHMMECPKAMLGGAVQFRRMVGRLPVEIAYAAHGGAIPLQFSDFGRRNVICSDLMDMYLDGCDDMGNSSTLVAWYVANNVETHAWDSAGKRGCVFLVEDKRPRVVRRTDAIAIFDRNDRIYPADAFLRAMDRWDVYVLVVSDYQSKVQDTMRGYATIVGKTRVVPVDNVESVPAIIASIICMREGGVAEGGLAFELALAGFGDNAIGDAVEAVRSVPYRLRAPKSSVEND